MPKAKMKRKGAPSSVLDGSSDLVRYNKILEAQGPSGP